MNFSTDPIRMETWSIDRLIPYARNPRKNDRAVDRMCSSIREFGFKIPCLVRRDGEVGVPIEAPERSGHPFIVIHRTASSGTAPEECSECTSKFPR